MPSSRRPATHRAPSRQRPTRRARPRARCAGAARHAEPTKPKSTPDAGRPPSPSGARGGAAAAAPPGAARMLTDHTRCTRAAAPMPSAALGCSLLGDGLGTARAASRERPRLERVEATPMQTDAAVHRSRARRHRNDVEGCQLQKGDSKTGIGSVRPAMPLRRGCSSLVIRRRWRCHYEHGAPRRARGLPNPARPQAGRRPLRASPAPRHIYQTRLATSAPSVVAAPALSSSEASKGSAAAIVRCT